MTTYECIEFTKDKGIARLVLNRPEKLNAMTKQMYLEVVDAITSLRNDYDSRVLIIKGAGRAFCAGDDLSEPSEMFYGTDYALEDEIARERYLHLRQWLWGWYDLLSNTPQATIAQVHGHCIVAGLELAMQCDLVLVADDAALYLDPFLGVGGKFTNLWPLHMGMRGAKEAFLRGRRLSGREAADLRMVNRSVPAQELESEAEEWAQDIAKLPLEFISFNKLAVNKFWDAMGLRQAVESTIDVHVMGATFEKRRQWADMRSELGWKEAAKLKDSFAP